MGGLRQCFYLICRVLYRHRLESDFRLGTCWHAAIEQGRPQLGILLPQAEADLCL
jgi:hypothetical protein